MGASAPDTIQTGPLGWDPSAALAEASHLLLTQGL